MTAPSYTNDLTTFNLCENSGTFGEFTGMVDGGAPDGTDTDDPIQGTYCTSAGCSLKVGELQSIYADYGSGVTVPTDGAILIWNKFDAGGTLQAYASGGVRIVIGASAVNWDAWKAAGVNTVPYPYGGWYNFALNPLARSYDYRGGTGTGTTYQFAGMAISLAAAGPSKGQPFKVDAIRYGRCTIIIEYGSLGDGYADFATAAVYNDDNTGTYGYNKWGLFQAVSGGYLWKGRMQIGTTSNACEFDDADAFILIDDVVNCTANFNTIEINHADTIVNWTNVIFKALGTTSPGRWVTNANAELNIISCQFFNMGAFSFGGSNSEFIGCIWNNCGQVTQAGATLTGCSFTESGAAIALAAGDLTLISGCDFTSDGTGYAIEGFASAASYTLTNLTFTGYASTDGVTGNEALHVLASSGTVTINYTGAAPSVHSAGATIVKVGSSVDVTVTVKTVAGVNVENARVLLKAKDGTGPFPWQETVTSITNSGTTATVAHTGHGMASNDRAYIYGASLIANNGVFQITVNGVDEYEYTMLSTPGSSPTGTIKCTFVALYGLSNALGVVTTSREYGSDQPVVGWCRLSTSSPLYKPAPLVGAVDDLLGFSGTGVMILDE